MTRRLPRKVHLKRLTICTVASWFVAAVAPTTFALSFGGEQVSSFLGQPLRVVIPLLGATGDSLEERCFRVVTPFRSDGLAVVSQARIELQTSSNPPRLIVRSGRSVDDPIVHMTIEAGCDNPIRRDYTILLDPPPLQPVESVPNRLPPIITPPALDGAAPSSSAAIVGTAGLGAKTASSSSRAARNPGERTTRPATAPEKIVQARPDQRTIRKSRYALTRSRQSRIGCACRMDREGCSRPLATHRWPLWQFRD